MKKLFALLVSAVLVTGCFYAAKEEAEKECDKAGEKCESVSESDLNS
jgi:PBP1b-binding outer membrane lipoprotein LpoB